MDDPGSEYREEQNIFIFSMKYRQVLGHNQSPCLIGIGYLFPRYSDRGVNLNPHLHLELRLGMSEAMPLLPLHAIMA